MVVAKLDRLPEDLSVEASHGRDEKGVLAYATRWDPEAYIFCSVIALLATYIKQRRKMAKKNTRGWLV